MSKEFYERYWNGKDKYLCDYHKKITLILNIIPNKKLTLLDVGCGNGIITKDIAEHKPNLNIIGIDISPKAIKEARKICPKGKFFEINEDGNFPIQDSSADFVFCSEVIEHIFDTSKFFGELNRVTKRNGKILLTTPYHNVVKNILIALFGFENHYSPTGAHIRFYTKKSLVCTLKKHGFVPTKISFYGRFFPIPWSICILAEKI